MHPKIRSRRVSSSRHLVAERHQRVAKLYLQCKPQHEIAQIEGISVATVAADLKLIQEQWRTEATLTYDDAKARELARIDDLERMAREGWERSCQDAVTKTEEKESALREEPLKSETADAGTGGLTGKIAKKKAKLITIGVKEKYQTKGQAGDARFLDTIAWCIEARRKIFGLDKEPESTGGTNVLVLPPDYFDRLSTRSAIVNPVDEAIKSRQIVAPKETSNGVGTTGRDST